jgi:hypothetical protein
MTTSGAEAKSRRQVAMAFDLSKCMGCQSCSVACKMLWTRERGEEYQWWCSVDTLPGSGTPRGREAMGGGYRDGGRSELIDTLIVYEWKSLFGPTIREPASAPPFPSAPTSVSGAEETAR